MAELGLEICEMRLFSGRIKDGGLKVESEFTLEPAIQICLKECPEGAARALILTVCVSQISVLSAKNVYSGLKNKKPLT